MSEPGGAEDQAGFAERLLELATELTSSGSVRVNIARLAYHGPPGTFVC